MKTKIKTKQNKTIKYPGGNVNVTALMPVVRILSNGDEAAIFFQEYGSTTKLPGTGFAICFKSSRSIKK